MDAVSDAPGWTIAEAIERTSDPDQSLDQESAMATGQKHRHVAFAGGREACRNGQFREPHDAACPDRSANLPGAEWARTDLICDVRCPGEERTFRRTTAKSAFDRYC